MTLEEALKLTKGQIKALSDADKDLVLELFKQEIERINKRNGK